MKIQNRTESYYNSNPNNRQVTFKATPAQILTKLETAKICPGKTNFLKNIAGFFGELQENLSKITDSPKEFIYKLGEKNELPETIKNVELGGITLAKVDDVLNSNPFKCSPTSTCGCGNGMTKGELTKKLLETIGLEEPEVIKIAKN